MVRAQAVAVSAAAATTASAASRSQAVCLTGSLLQRMLVPMQGKGPGSARRPPDGCNASPVPASGIIRPSSPLRDRKAGGARPAVSRVAGRVTMAPTSPNRRPLAEGLGFSSLAVHAGERLPAFDTKPVTTPIYSTVAFEAPSAAELDAVFDGTRRRLLLHAARQPDARSARGDHHPAGARRRSDRLLVRHGRAPRGAPGGRREERRPPGLEPGSLRCDAGAVSRRDGAARDRHALRARHRPGGVRSRRRRRPAARGVRRDDLEPAASGRRLAAIAEIAREAGATAIVDSTFASPRLLTPLALGADFVVHSTTKYLNGHGDATGGIVVCASRRDRDAPAGVEARRRHPGTVRGVPDTARREDAGAPDAEAVPQSARQIAESGARIPPIETVHYPGLPSHPDHAVASRLLRDGLAGAVVSFVLRERGEADVFRFMDACGCAAPARRSVTSSARCSTRRSRRTAP